MKERRCLVAWDSELLELFSALLSVSLFVFPETRLGHRGFYHEGSTDSNNVRTAAAKSGDVDVKIAWLLSGSVARETETRAVKPRAGSKTSLLSFKRVFQSPAKRIFLWVLGCFGALSPLSAPLPALARNPRKAGAGPLSGLEDAEQGEIKCSWTTC